MIPIPIDKSTTNASWTHRSYFKRFNLNVEQYGEILVAQAFGGVKKGDAQPCYDVETSDQEVRARLLASGASLEKVDSSLSAIQDKMVRIEVKSKLARTPSGVATVIHCSKNKTEGTRKHPPATHFAVILFDGDGQAEHAWFFATDVAKLLQQGKSRYIPVSSLKKPAPIGKHDVIDVCSLINGIASSVLSDSA